MDDIGDQPTIIAWAFRGFEINQDQRAPPLAITQPMVELVGVTFGFQAQFNLA
jgi:hypothetical protein